MVEKRSRVSVFNKTNILNVKVFSPGKEVCMMEAAKLGRVQRLAPSLECQNVTKSGS